MSAFYDLASLVLVPSGYKASKVYAQKPLTTDGQLTFSRASTATRVNSAGLIETVSSNVPRLDYLGSTCPKLQLEPQRSNLLLYSSAFDNAWWTNSGNIVANTAVAPDGTTTADTGGAVGVYPSNGVGDSTTVHTASIFAKANPSGASTLNFGMNRYGFGDFITCTFNLATGTAGTVTTGGSATGASAKIENYGNGWYRCSITGIASDSAGSLSFNPNNTCFIWGAQLEAGAYATSYIPTTTAAVTRLADACEKQSITSLIGQTAGTIYWESNQVGGAQLALNTTNNVSSDGLQIYASSNTLNIFILQGGTVRLITSIGAVTEGTNFKIALAYGTNFVMVYINGVQTYTTTATIPMPTLTMLNLAFYGGGATAAKSETKQVLLFKSILTPVQLAELTAL